MLIASLNDVVITSLGLGIFINTIFLEVATISAGGIITAGYIALCLQDPVRLALTFLASFTAFVTVRWLSNYMIIYGKRMMTAMILAGFLTGLVISWIFVSKVSTGDSAGIGFTFDELKVVGFIVPGLIAYWFERQGVLLTLAAITIASIMTRLALISIFGNTLGLTIG